MQLTQLIEALQRDLDLPNLTLAKEFRYRNLLSCLVDSIFSIGVKYESVSKTVHTYWSHPELAELGRVFPDYLYDLNATEVRSDEDSIQCFLKLFGQQDPQLLADSVFKNRQRTSSTNGVLKAQVVLDAAVLLSELNITTFKSIQSLFTEPAQLLELERRFMQLKGQSSGISFKYFLMLAGSEQHIKPDRMVLRYVESALKCGLGIDQSENLLVQAAHALRERYDHITPRLIDNAVWNFQRSLATDSGRLKLVADCFGSDAGNFKLKLIFTDSRVQGRFAMDRANLADIQKLLEKVELRQLADWGGRRGHAQSVMVDFERMVVKLTVQLD